MFKTMERQTRTKSKLALCLGFFGLLLTFFYLEVRSESFSVLQGGTGETTIRNVTSKNVRYSITPIDSSGKPEKRSLKPGEIDRFLKSVNYDVTYKQGKKSITRRIYRGRPYSFRLNEDDKLYLYDGSHGRTDAPDLAPYVPTPMFVVEKMLEMAHVDSEDILCDLGCGDGRIVIAAAEKHGARGVGIDIDPVRISESIANAILAGVEDRVEFLQQDVMKIDFSKATVLALYLLPESLEMLRPLFEHMLAPGTYVVSHNYSIPGWQDKEVDYVSLEEDSDRIHTIYVYRR
jgi:hypothetical protein